MGNKKYRKFPFFCDSDLNFFDKASLFSGAISNMRKIRNARHEVVLTWGGFEYVRLFSVFDQKRFLNLMFF